MSTLLQVSDTHFGTVQPQVMDALEHLNASLRPDVLLLSGDITQRARPAEFAAAAAFVARLQAPAVIAIPGNHDIPLYDPLARLFWPYRNFRRAFGPELESAFESDSLLLLGLNTTRRYRHVDGEISRNQIERVAQRLAQARPGQWRAIAVHQPVAVTREIDRVNLLHGHEQAVRRWSEAGADLVIGGHIHLPFVLALHERWPELPRPVWAVQAGTALSNRVRFGAGNSVNVIRSDAHRCQIERWDYDDAAQAFRAAGVTTLNR
jgi:3',5'-cyclic AMP phosphodiesterase CpdA